MPGALPEADDAYLCSSFKVKDWIETDTVFINKFHVKTTAKKVHHMLIYACDSPPEKPGKIWYVFNVHNTHTYNLKDIINCIFHYTLPQLLTKFLFQELYGPCNLPRPKQTNLCVGKGRSSFENSGLRRVQNRKSV